MDKPLQFKYTKDGMVTVPGTKAEFVSVNEMLGFINELVNEKTRMLENYTEVDENSDVWIRRQKAVLEGQKQELERVKKLLY